MVKSLLEFWQSGANDPFDVLFLHAPVMMHSIDENGVLVDVSNFWLEKLGYTSDEVIGKRSTEFLTDASRLYATSEVLPLFKQSGSCHNISYDFVRKDGSVLPVLLSATAQFDAEGNFVRSLAILFDNTDAKQYMGSLEEKIREAQEANAAKSHFLAAMSHEIRTPLNAILGFAQLLSRSDMPANDLKMTEAILTSGNTLMRLLTDLLDLSRIESGSMVVEKETFSLHQMMNDLRDSWAAEAHQKGLALNVSMGSDVPDRVVSDAGRVNQILNNYLSNACKFTEAGRIVLRVRVLQTLEGQARLRFEVQDTGPGLTEKQMGKLFKPFVQAGTDYTKQQGGWGLGLSICRQLSDLLGGRVGVTCKPEGGAEFYFELTADIPGLEGKKKDTVYKASNKSAHILVAEDNDFNQMLISELLQRLGHTFTIVDNGLEALEAVEKDKFDLILMDIVMPKMDGVVATERIRALTGEKSTIPIIAVTANVGCGMREKYLASGMNDYLPKPIHWETLEKSIDGVLITRQGHQH